MRSRSEHGGFQVESEANNFYLFNRIIINQKYEQDDRIVYEQTFNKYTNPCKRNEDKIKGTGWSGPPKKMGLKNTCKKGR